MNNLKIEIPVTLVQVATICIDPKTHRTFLKGIHISADYIEGSDGIIVAKLKHRQIFDSDIVLDAAPVRKLLTPLSAKPDDEIVSFDVVDNIATATYRQVTTQVDIINEPYPDVEKAICDRTPPINSEVGLTSTDLNKLNNLARVSNAQSISLTKYGRVTLVRLDTNRPHSKVSEAGNTIALSTFKT
jgi:hypothetical protein